MSKSSIKDLFNDLLNETKGFKYQVTLKVSLKKYKPNGEIEFTLVYFDSIKTVINHKFSVENAFQEILMLFKKFCTGLITGLMKDLAELLNQSSLNTVTFQLIDHYQEVLMCNCLLN